MKTLRKRTKGTGGRGERMKRKRREGSTIILH